MFDDTGFDSELPHLAYNENTTLVDVVLDRLRPHDRKSRFAVEIVLVADVIFGGDMTMSKRDNLDDEHSPGSFHVGICHYWRSFLPTEMRTQM